MPDTDPLADNSSANVTQGGLTTGEGSSITVGQGDVTGRDKITAGRDVIYAGTVIIGEKPAAPATADEAPAPGGSPFKGLQYFDEADAELFFGREALVEKLVERLSPLATDEVTDVTDAAGRAGASATSVTKSVANFLAIIGASGSGKSSLVRAGLIPALRQEPDWLIAPVFTPTESPHYALAGALLTLLEPSASETDRLIENRKLAEAFKANTLSLNDVVARIQQKTPNTTRVLVVADQFEELFTACKDADERRTFVNHLLNAVQSAGPAMVLITLRADFYAHCAQYDSLREAVAKQQEYIGPMTADELRRAIEEPARRGEWELEPGLVETLLKDIGAGENRQPEPGGLPLLSHALLETWNRRRGRKLTLRGYAESGGVRGAIARTAESVFARLSPLGQTIARRIFISLTELGEGTQDTRRRALISELSPNPDEAANVQAVLKLLADERLVTTDEKTAEVAHEALIREWPALRGWLDEDREGLRLHRQLTHDANEWARLDHDEGALYRGARLAQVSEWAEKHADDLSPLEREFVATSLELAEREIAEREAQQRRELEAAQKLAEIEKERAEDQTRSAMQLRKAQRYLQAGLVTLLIFAVMSLIFGSQASLAANRNATLAAQNEIIAGTAQAASTQAFELAAEQQSLALVGSVSQALDDRDPDLALALALQANDIENPPQAAQSALIEAAYASYTRQRIDTRESWVLSVDISSDGLYAVSGSFTGIVSVWDLKSGNEIQHFMPLTSPNQVWSVAFSPDGQTILAGYGNGDVVLWNAESGAVVHVMKAHTTTVRGTTFTPDGLKAVTGALDTRLILWDLTNGQILRDFTGHTGAVLSVAVSPDGKKIVSGSEDNTLIVWDVITGRISRRLIGHSGYVLSVAFNPDGNSILSGSADSSLILWNVETGAMIRSMEGHINWVNSVVFGPDGKTALSASADHSLMLRDIQTGLLIQRLDGHSDEVQSVAISQDGRLAVSGARDGSIRVWDIAAFREMDGSLENVGAEIMSMAVSPDGSRLLTGLSDGRVILWSIESNAILKEWLGHNTAVSDVAFSPDGLRALTGSHDMTLALWDLATGNQILSLEGHTGAIRSIAFSPDGSAALSGATDSKVILWNFESQPPRYLEGHTNIVTTVVFGPDGKTAISGSHDHSLILWDLVNGISDFPPYVGHDSWVLSADFSPDGQTIVSASNDQTIILWDTATRRVIRRLRGHDGPVLSVSFSPDGGAVLSGSSDGTLILWSVASGRLLRRFYSPPDESCLLAERCRWVWEVAYSPKGDGIFSVSADGHWRTWEMIPSNLNQLRVWLQQNRYLRTLTPEEQKQYGISDK